MESEINRLASEILAHEPGPVVRYRVLRDVLGSEPDDPRFSQAKQDLEHSFWVEGLAAEQWEDGSWGAFHSKNTRRKQKIRTTEMGVERARNLGLDAYHPVLQNSSEYIRNVMRGVLPFPDRREKNDRWDTGVRIFLGSTLSLIHPQDPLLNADRDLWFEIASKTFQSGQYSPEDERNAHASLTGATVKDSYLVLSGKYQLNILGSIPGTLPQEIERSLLTWLWSLPGGIGYLSVPLYKPPPIQMPGHIDRWLASLELLARLFPSWMDFAQTSIEWIWDQKNEQGYWDFGTRPATMVYLPLSDNWRKRGTRAIDWTTRILILLQTYSQSANVPV